MDKSSVAGPWHFGPDPTGGPKTYGSGCGSGSATLDNRMMIRSSNEFLENQEKNHTFRRARE